MEKLGIWKVELKDVVTNEGKGRTPETGPGFYLSHIGAQFLDMLHMS